MLKKKQIRSVIIALCFLFLGWGPLTLAESQNGFSISPINPTTGEPQSTYYDLTVVPRQKQTLKVRLFNSQNEDMTVKVQANEAGTNNNGVITYAGQEKQDASLRVPFSRIAHFETEEVVIPKQSSKDVALQIEVPSEPFKGIILGGIRVTEVIKNASKAQAASVKANVAYSVAVVLREQEETMDPSMHLLGVGQEVRNYRNYLSAELQNSAPRLIKKLETKASVYKKGSNKLLYEAEKTSMEMAPNSKFKFGINLEQRPVKAGKYVMKVSGKADGKPYQFEQEFEITEQEAKALEKNRLYVSDDQSNNNWIWVLVACLVLLLLLGIGCFMIGYEKRKARQKGED